MCTLFRIDGKNVNRKRVRVCAFSLILNAMNDLRRRIVHNETQSHDILFTFYTYTHMDGSEMAMRQSSQMYIWSIEFHCTVQAIYSRRYVNCGPQANVIQNKIAREPNMNWKMFLYALYFGLKSMNSHRNSHLSVCSMIADSFDA